MEGLDAVVALVALHYGRPAVVERSLPGETDRNYLVRLTDDSTRWVVKLSSAQHPVALLHAEASLMAHVRARDASFVADQLRCSRGQPVVSLEDGGTMRVLSFLPGTPLSTVTKRGPWIPALARRMARFHKDVASFSAPPALQRGPHFEWDLANYAAVLDTAPVHVKQGDVLRLLARVREVSQALVTPLVPSLPKGVIHNDWNPGNILVDPLGLIDWSDACVSHTINDVAIFVAYALLAEPDSEAASGFSADVVRAYELERPLTEQERAAVFPLAALRLCTSIVIAAKLVRASGQPFLLAPSHSLPPVCCRSRQQAFAHLARDHCAQAAYAAS